MQSFFETLDKNGDGKSTINDMQVLFQRLGFDSISPCQYLLF